MPLLKKPPLLMPLIHVPPGESSTLRAAYNLATTNWCKLNITDNGGAVCAI